MSLKAASCLATFLFFLDLLSGSISTADAQCSFTDQNDTHVVFVGDSIMRYQYLSLAYFLEYGRWPGTVSGAVDPTLEGSFSSWVDFFQLTTALFDQEVCDCYRYKIVFKTAMENRYYRNSRLRLRLSYFLSFGNYRLRGHNLSATGHVACEPGFCGSAYDWIRPLPLVLKEIIPQLHPTHVFLNLGHWVSEDRPMGFWAEVCNISQPMKAAGTEFFWATTTTTNKGAADVPVGATVPNELLACGFRVFDRWNLTLQYLALHGEESTMADRLHLKSPVNRAMNEEFMRLMRWRAECNPPSLRLPPSVPEARERYASRVNLSVHPSK